MELKTYPLPVTCNGKEGVGTYRLEHYTKKEAIFKGIRMWLITMLVAALSIVIPLVHFVSVPVGLAISPLVGVYYFFARRDAPKRVIGDFHCPECQAENHVETTRIDKYYIGHCAHCQHEFKMVPPPHEGKS